MRPDNHENENVSIGQPNALHKRDREWLLPSKVLENEGSLNKELQVAPNPSDVVRNAPAYCVEPSCESSNRSLVHPEGARMVRWQMAHGVKGGVVALQHPAIFDLFDARIACVLD